MTLGARHPMGQDAGMGTVDEYLAGLEPTERAELERIGARVRELVPDVGQGTSYGMPVYLYRGWQLMSTMAAKHHLAIYPYSGDIVPALAEELAGFDAAKGTIRFTARHPLPDEVLDRVILLRKAEIEARKPR